MPEMKRKKEKKRKEKKERKKSSGLLWTEKVSKVSTEHSEDNRRDSLGFLGRVSIRYYEKRAK